MNFQAVDSAMDLDALTQLVWAPNTAVTSAAFS